MKYYQMKEKEKRGGRKEGSRRKGGERKGRRIPMSKETWRLDSSGQRQQQIFEGQKANERVQVSTEGTDSHSRTSERLRNCLFRHCKREE